MTGGSILIERIAAETDLVLGQVLIFCCLLLTRLYTTFNHNTRNDRPITAGR